MWFAYVDESYNKLQHWVAAVLVEHTRVNQTHREIRNIVERASDAYGIDDEAELHGYELFGGEGAFEPMKKLVRARVGIYADVFQCLSDCDCRIVLRGVSKAGLIRRYIHPEHPHRVTMTHLIERVDSFCKGQDEHALLVADEHHETQSALLRDLVTYQEWGTWGYLAKKIERIVDTIHFVTSSTNPLVQGADLVAFLTRRRATHKEKDPRAEKTNEDLWQIIEPRIYDQHCWYP